MKSGLIYIEEVTANHDGKAWIGKCFFSKTGRSVYFNGNVYGKGNSASSNYFDIETGSGYWISGVKKDGGDRHKFGKGIIQIDKSIVDEYLEITGQAILKKKEFRVVELNNIPAKDKATEIRNEKLEPDFDSSVRFKKKPNELTEEELENLIRYYGEMDFATMYKKGRKKYIEALNELKSEQESRRNSYKKGLSWSKAY